MAKNYLLIIVMIILSIAALMIASYYQYHYHEYGHVLKIIENSVKDANNYITETNTSIINIQVAKLGIWKRKTYSNYFEYLENKKQETKYQEIIKDITVGGRNFSINVVKHIKFHKPYIIALIYITTIILSIVILLDIKQLLLLFMYFAITIIFYIFCILAYVICVIGGYGINILKSKNKEGMSDRQIFKNPSKFKYINLTEDEEQLQKQNKILLDIKIDLNNKKYPVIVIPRDNLYKKIIQEFPLNSETELTFLFFLKNDNKN